MRVRACVTVSAGDRPPDTNISAHSLQQHSASHSKTTIFSPFLAVYSMNHRAVAAAFKQQRDLFLALVFIISFFGALNC